MKSHEDGESAAAEVEFDGCGEEGDDGRAGRRPERPESKKSGLPRPPPRESSICKKGRL